MKRILVTVVATFMLAVGVASQTGSAARVDSTIDQATSPDIGARDSGYHNLPPQVIPAPGLCMAACGDYATAY